MTRDHHAETVLANHSSPSHNTVVIAEIAGEQTTQHRVEAQYATVVAP